MLSVSAAVRIATRENPNLAQMRERYRALASIPSQAGTLPDPVVSVNAMNFPVSDFHRRPEAMTQLQLGIMQSFPFPGKLVLRKEAAEFQALAAGHSVDVLRLELTSTVRSKWWQIHYLDQVLVTIKNNRKLFHELIEVAKAKYETGSGLQQDVLLAQLELSRLIDQEIRVKAMRSTQAVQLNVLMDMPTRGSVILAKNESVALPVLSGKERFFEKAEHVSPILRQTETETEVASTKLRLARKDVYPDFSVGLTYGDRRGDNPPPGNSPRDSLLSLMIGVKVPLFHHRRQAKMIDQRAAELQQTHYIAADRKGRVMGAISAALIQYDRAREVRSLYRDGIIPQASQTVQAMLAGYRVNEVDFLNLVRAQVDLLNYQLEYWNSLTEAKQSLARLEAAVGEESIYE